MALRVAVTRLPIQVKPSILRINNTFSRMKHYTSNESPLAKHAKKPTSTIRVIGIGSAIGVCIGVLYTYFNGPERKLPGTIINTPNQVSKLKTLPPDLKVTRKV